MHILVYIQCSSGNQTVTYFKAEQFCKEIRINWSPLLIDDGINSVRIFRSDQKGPASSPIPLEAGNEPITYRLNDKDCSSTYVFNLIGEVRNPLNYELVSNLTIKCPRELLITTLV